MNEKTKTYKFRIFTIPVLSLSSDNINQMLWKILFLTFVGIIIIAIKFSLLVLSELIKNRISFTNLLDRFQKIIRHKIYIFTKLRNFIYSRNFREHFFLFSKFSRKPKKIRENICKHFWSSSSTWVIKYRSSALNTPLQ